MASVDGSRASDKPMDALCKFECDSCAYSGLVKEASEYCKQCGEYMCVTCSSIHRGLKLTRNHIMVSGSDLILTGQSVTKKLSLVYCEKHGDKVIEWFCEKDEAEFCDICKITKHRKCEVISVSDKLASEFGPSLDNVIGSLESFKFRIENLISAREKSAEGLANFRRSCESAVQQFKSNIIEKVERMENEILTEINKVVNTETAAIKDHVNTCDSLIPEVEAELNTAEEAKAVADEVTSVIAAHKLSKILKTLEPTVAGLELEVYDVDITFQPSRQLTDVFSEIDQLGILVIDRTEPVDTDPHESLSPVSGHTSWLDMEVLSVSSMETNVLSDYVTGSAVMPDGRLILADNLGKQIVLFDKDFNIESTLELPGSPWQVAVYGDNAAVVTMSKKRQKVQLKYIHVDTELRDGHTIATELQCRGVAVHANEIYVHVFGGKRGDNFRVMDTRGTVIRHIGMDVRGKSVYSNYLTVGTEGALYHTNSGGFSGPGHITYRTNVGYVVYSVQHEGAPRGILADEEGNLLVCCSKSNAIEILGKDGARHKVILSSTDVVVCPQSVSYRRSDQTLIVTMGNTPACRAFKLK